MRAGWGCRWPTRLWCVRHSMAPIPTGGECWGHSASPALPFDQSRVEIAFAGITVCRSGVAVPVDEEGLSKVMQADFDVAVVVGDGPGTATVVTTDLTPDYVRFNSDRS